MRGQQQMAWSKRCTKCLLSWVTTETSTTHSSIIVDILKMGSILHVDMILKLEVTAIGRLA
jgi:hypothetical protein